MERRTHLRHRTIFRPAYLSTDSGLHYVVMRNVSSDGASFSGLEGLQEGEWITYFVGTSGPVDAVVRWTKDDKFGVQNVVEVENLAGSGSNFPYRSVRIPFVAEIRLYSCGWRTSATLYNFSQGGACVASSAHLARGELVTLELAGLVIEAAETKWIKGRQAGVKFAKSLDRQTMQMTLDQLQCRPASDETFRGDRDVRTVLPRTKGSLTCS